MAHPNCCGRTILRLAVLDNPRSRPRRSLSPGRVEDWCRCSVGPAYLLLPVSVGSASLSSHTGASLRLRSCRLMGAFVISPLPPFLIKTPCAARPLGSTGVTPLLRYYGPCWRFGTLKLEWRETWWWPRMTWTLLTCEEPRRRRHGNTLALRASEIVVGLFSWPTASCSRAQSPEESSRVARSSSAPVRRVQLR